MCAGNCKPDKKSVEVSTTTRRSTPAAGTPMFSTRSGMSVSINYLSGAVARELTGLMPDFTIHEGEDGQLIINTGLFRSKPLLGLMAGPTCSQPCKGDCENCPGHRVPREPAGL